MPPLPPPSLWDYYLEGEDPPSPLRALSPSHSRPSSSLPSSSPPSSSFEELDPTADRQQLQQQIRTLLQKVPLPNEALGGVFLELMLSFPDPYPFLEPLPVVWGSSTGQITLIYSTLKVCLFVSCLFLCLFLCLFACGKSCCLNLRSDLWEIILLLNSPIPLPPQTVLETDRELLLPVLSCLCRFSLPKEIEDSVREVTLQAMEFAHQRDLPSLTR